MFLDALPLKVANWRRIEQVADSEAALCLRDAESTNDRANQGYLSL
jgi:hypothetical protein